jgi:hypothetical protein
LKIGPAALVTGSRAAENRGAVNESLSGVLTEIRSLLDVPADAEQPPRAVVEDALTSGYAHALALESEQLRTEGHLRVILRDGSGSRRLREERIDQLTGRLAELDQQLAGLRALLSSLRAQAL